MCDPEDLSMDLSPLYNLFDFRSPVQAIVGLLAVVLMATGMASIFTGELGLSIWRAFGVGRRPVSGFTVVVLGFAQGLIGFWLLSRYVSIPSLKFW